MWTSSKSDNDSDLQYNLRVTDSTVTENSVNRTPRSNTFGKYHQNFYKMGTGHQV